MEQEIVVESGCTMTIETGVQMYFDTGIGMKGAAHFELQYMHAVRNIAKF